MFQSSPTPRGGRYFESFNARGLASRFQSSPTPRGGRYQWIDS